VPVLALSAYDEACVHAGLLPRARYAGWDDSPYDDGGYAVSVHEAPRRLEEGTPENQP
jgi:hypothetical protein